ncbi:glycosyl transferase family 2 [mine drainage metagenome]|uniref:Glycosyl transferase family 2 n=1 Tax=mine drainage metagenome TaxID=410659 RepID=A0A1J5RS34_9ZZZZ
MDILVLDSSSTDATMCIVEESGCARFHRIDRKDFNHGATRELARRLLNTDIVILLTQDVVLLPGVVSALVEPLVCRRADIAYARQLPHVGAGLLEAFPRLYNYPSEPQNRSLEDVTRYGVYTFFCSDSCAAYRNEALERIGGFRAILTNEDYFAAARILRVGGRIEYVSRAEVRHSHCYSLWEEFVRYFDTGFVRAQHPWVNSLVGNAENRGAGFAFEFLRAVGRSEPLKIGYAFFQLCVKWLGFRIGYISFRFAGAWCRYFSSQRYYWESEYVNLETVDD